MPRQWRRHALSASVAAALSAAALSTPAPALASGGFTNGTCTASTESSPSPYVDPCDSGKVNFLGRYDSLFNSYLYGGNYASAVAPWMVRHEDRAIAYDASLFQPGTYNDRGLYYAPSYSIPKANGAPISGYAGWTLKTAADHSKYQYVNYNCSGGTCSAYAGDIANPAFRAQHIHDIFYGLTVGGTSYLQGYDYGHFAGLWLDDVPLRNMSVDGSQAGGDNPTTAWSPYLGRDMTENDWRIYTKALLQEFRAYQVALDDGSGTITPFARPTEILINAKWNPNEAGGGMANSDAQDIVSQADWVDLEGMADDVNHVGGTGTYSMSNVRDFVRRIHNVGTGVIWDNFGDTSSGSLVVDPVAREFGTASMLLTNAGNDGVGLSDSNPANWWAGFDVDLGAATTHLPFAATVASGPTDVLERDFANGTVLLKDPTPVKGDPATQSTVNLPTPMVDMAGKLVSSVTLSSRQAAILRKPGSTGTKSGARRADFLAASDTGAKLGLDTRRGVAGPLASSTLTGGTRGTYTGDVDNDGVDEVVKLDTGGGYTIYRVNAGTGAPTVLSSGTTTLPAGATFLADVTGDHKADLISWVAGTAYVAAVSPSNVFLTPAPRTLPASFYGNTANLMADMDGNGKADLVAWNSDGTVTVSLTTGAAAFGTPTTWVSQSGFVGSLGNLACDVTKDGKADLVAVSPSIKSSVTNSSGTAGGAPGTSIGSWTQGNAGSQYLCADVDADGDGDIISWSSSQMWATPTFYGGTTPTFYNSRPIGVVDPFFGNKANVIGEFDRE